MFKFVGDFLGRLWGVANFWRVSPIGQARVGSSLAGLLLFLCLVFFVIGVILTVLGAIFGFDLDDVDRWIESQGGWMSVVGAILIQKVLMAVVLLFCVGIGVVLVFFRDKDAPGWGKTMLMLLVCLLLGYCSAVNVIAPLDP